MNRAPDHQDDAFPIKDGNHALLTGLIVGTLMQVTDDVKPVIDEHGDYTAEVRIRVKQDSPLMPGRWISLVVLSGDDE